MLSLFPLDVLDEIFDSIEADSRFYTYLLLHLSISDVFSRLNFMINEIILILILIL